MPADGRWDLTRRLKGLTPFNESVRKNGGIAPYVLNLGTGWQLVGVTSRRTDILRGYSGSYRNRKCIGYQRRGEKPQEVARGFRKFAENICLSVCLSLHPYKNNAYSAKTDFHEI